MAVVALALLACASATSRAESPLDDATFVWHMADESNAVAATGRLAPRGVAKLGVALSGPDRDESLRRGGDGLVAQFAGGYLTLADDGDLTLNPKSWSILARVRDPSGAWQGTIVGDDGDDQHVSVALRGVDGAEKPRSDRNLNGGSVPTVYAWLTNPGGPRSVPGSPAILELVWGAREPNAARVDRIKQMQPESSWPNPLQQDVLNGIMKPFFPVGLIGATDWHDVVVSLTGPKLELWIDGVLVDEEYPIGLTRQRTLPFVVGDGFSGMIDHVALWQRALTAREIALISGGAEHVRKQELAILGDESTSMQYFRPRGHNRKAGDLIPYWDSQTDTFRLFYLILRRNMHSKWDGGHGGLEIWQASTKDLKAWTHHPVTIPITEQWEAWNGTGAVAFHNGQYNWFYPTPDYDGSHGGIQRAVSGDGVHFTKTKPHPFLEGGDCEIFQTEDGAFHMVKTGPARRANTKPLTDKTFVAWVQLADLEQAGGSVLTIEHPDGATFDALVFGERCPRRWMPGSNNFRRTPPAQTEWLEEQARPDEVVQMALVFRGRRGTLYRNGVEYTSYDIAEPVTFPSGSSLIVGKRHTTAGPPERAFFHGRVLDARLYDTALTAEQIDSLQCDAASGPQPLAWYDFEGGSTQDKMGNFPDGCLHGNARIENGELTLTSGDYLKAPGTSYTQTHLVSEDLETWLDQEAPFISSDKRLATCPNIFKFGKWYYYLCSSGFWRSPTALGPWTEHQPMRIDNLAVPKTGAFGNDRRIYAGFLSDGGWGGNSILRELVQTADGQLGTRFVPEMVPACGAPLPVEPSVRLRAERGRQVFELQNIPNNFRLQLEVVPHPGATRVGIELRADDREAGCELILEPQRQRVRFTKMTDSSGGGGAGPGIEAVAGLNRPFKIDLIARHDILDAEVAEFRSVTTRFWNPDGDRIRLSAENGAVTFRNIVIRPLEEAYQPYPGWSSHAK